MSSMKYGGFKQVKILEKTVIKYPLVYEREELDDQIFDLYDQIDIDSFTEEELEERRQWIIEGNLEESYQEMEREFDYYKIYSYKTILCPIIDGTCECYTMKKAKVINLEDVVANAQSKIIVKKLYLEMTRVLNKSRYLESTSLKKKKHVFKHKLPLCGVNYYETYIFNIVAALVSSHMITYKAGVKFLINLYVLDRRTNLSGDVKRDNLGILSGNLVFIDYGQVRLPKNEKSKIWRQKK